MSTAPPIGSVNSGSIAGIQNRADRTTHTVVLSRFVAFCLAVVVFSVLFAACASGPDLAEPQPADLELVTTQVTADDADFTLPQGLGRSDEPDPTGPMVDDAAVRPTFLSPGETLADPSVGPGSSTTTPIVQASTSTTSTSTTIAGIAPWRIGLLNTEASTLGSFEAYRIGIEAAFGWRSTQLAVLERRTFELVACSTTDAASAAACASQVSIDTDAVVSGIDMFAELTLPIVEVNATPIMGGYALGVAEATTANALFDLGGPPVVHAAMATAFIDEQPDVVAVFHDDTVEGADLVARFVLPTLTRAGVTAELIAITDGGANAADGVSQADIARAEQWIVATGAASCVPIATAKQQAGSMVPSVWSTSCNDAATLNALTSLVTDARVAFELVETELLGVANTALRSDYDTANLAISQVAPEYVGDPLALAGYVTGMRVVDLIDQFGPNVQAARELVSPRRLSTGSVDCSTPGVSICAGDVMFVTIAPANDPNGNLVVGPIETKRAILQ